MILWSISLNLVSFMLIVFGTIGISKSHRKSIKYISSLAFILGMGLVIVPVLSTFGGWMIAFIIFAVLIVIVLAFVFLSKVQNKIRKCVGITVLLLLVIVGGPAWILENLNTPSAEQYNQLEQVIRTHDVSKIKELSADKETEELLLKLPKNAKVTPSDFQGGGPVGNGNYTIGYFPARIGGYDVNTYMITKTGFQFIPHWKLIIISNSLFTINSMKIDPNWSQN